MPKSKKIIAGAGSGAGDESFDKKRNKKGERKSKDIEPLESILPIVPPKKDNSVIICEKINMLLQKDVTGMKIGIDFGGVLSVHDSRKPVPKVTTHHLETHETPESSETLVLDPVIVDDVPKTTTSEKVQQHDNINLDMPGALEVLEKMKKRGIKLYLISFCGATRAKETYEALVKEKYDKLFEMIFFVKSKDHKKIVCDAIGCHYMIDDTVSILESFYKEVYMKNKTIPILFDSTDTTALQTKRKYNYFTNWNDIYEFLKSSKPFDVVKTGTINPSHIYMV